MNQPAEPPSAGNLQEWLKWSETKIALSLGVSFYIKPPRSGYADGMLECYREFLDLCEPQLKWYASELGTYRKATPKVLRIPFHRLREAMDHDKEWGWCAGGGEHHRDASPCQFRVLAGTDKYELNLFRAGFPVEMFSSDLGRFVALVKRFAERLPFFFGYAGFFFNNSLEASTQQQNEQYLLPVAMRFSGVEVEHDTATILCCEHSIKGVNWLTLLSPSLVEQLGGKAPLRAHLSESVVLHDLATGLMIQAGPEPGLGDVNAGERLPCYREVHRALTPVRNLNHYALGPRLFRQNDATRRWMNRFDD
jgi:hypothetical protein